MDKSQKIMVNAALTKLDRVANTLERLASDGKIDKEWAAKSIHSIDSYADKLQVAAFGPDSLKRHQAKVIKKDSDEPYMDTFDNPVKPIQTDADESYMHKVDKSFNSDAIDTFDNDRSNAVTDRKEHDVRDLSEWSDSTKPQPSWTGGKGGKSTRQGTSRNATYDEKEWA